MPGTPPDAAFWEDTKRTLQETWQAANEARAEARSARQTIEELLKPKVEKIEITVGRHSAAINRARGAIWAIGVTAGSLSLMAAGVAAWAALR